MIVPLAALIEYLKTEKKEIHENYRKIDRWYWMPIFIARYDQAADIVSYQDYKKVKEWIKSNQEPNFLSKMDLLSVNLKVSKLSSAIYRGVIGLIVL